jgi:MYXO-CTERM domain-containing protein
MRAVFILVLMLAPGAAKEIEVSDFSSVTLGTGDELRFHFGIWNYGVHAARGHAASPYPTLFSFDLISDTNLYSGESVRLEARLDSVRGGSSFVFEPLEFFEPATYSGAGESYPVLSLSSRLSLTAFQSAGLFGAGALDRYADGAVLVFRNTGNSLTLGLPRRPVSQLLIVSLASESLSLGATRGTVLLSANTLDQGAALRSLNVVATPEPALGGVVLIGILLFALARRRRV